MEKVSREVADKEVNEWLDKKKVFQSTRESNQGFFDVLVEATMNGVLVFNQDGTITHFLLHPLESEVITKEITYKARLNDKMIQPQLLGVKPNDENGRFLAYVAALTGVPKAALAVMDSLDKKITQAVVSFFV